MSRLSHLAYVDQRGRLCDTWYSDKGKFSILSPQEQWDLHNFYLITQHATSLELRLHRQVVKRIDPSLPQRAGRAYAKLERGEPVRAAAHAVTSKGRAIVVRSVVKPKPDLRRLSRAIIAIRHEPDADKRD